MSAENKEIPVPSGREEERTLEEWLAGVTGENRRPEVDTGAPVGKEVDGL